MRGGGGVPCTHGPPQAPIFRFFGAIFDLFFMGIRRTSCYHALRQPVGAVDRAMLHN